MFHKLFSKPQLIKNLIIPLLNLISVFIILSILFVIFGVNPFQALQVLVLGSFGSAEALAYTLYFSTNYIFMALGFTFASRAGVFNIGCEGQAYLGGLGMTLAFMSLGFLPMIIIIPLGVLVAMLFGGALALLCAYLKVYRSSHEVITTIMFNFIVASIMVLILNKIKDGPSLETAYFNKNTFLPSLHSILPFLPKTPLNLSFVIAVILSILVLLFFKYTSIGYEIKVLGQNKFAAQYAGISEKKIILIAMMLSGSIASLASLNEISGVHHRLIQDFVAGTGFAGIAVALMGRSHPIGILIASILFGALYQGGGELAFEFDAIGRDIVVIMQGLIILFAGAFENLYSELFFKKILIRSGV